MHAGRVRDTPGVHACSVYLSRELYCNAVTTCGTLEVDRHFLTLRSSDQVTVANEQSDGCIDMTRVTFSVKGN